MANTTSRDTDPADKKRIGRATRPKLAATVILLRKSHAGDTRFLMGKRASKHRFMPGKFVFPGGRVDAADARAPVAKPLLPSTEVQLCNTLTPRRALATASAALRETYEETGLKLASPNPSMARNPAMSYQAFSDNRLGLDLSSLRVLARAITPPYHPKRFDTWFFTASTDNLIDDPNDLASGELEELQWVTFDQAEKLDLPTITKMVLQDLQAGHDRDENPTPFYFTKRGNHVREWL